VSAENRPCYLLYEGRSQIKGLNLNKIYEIDLSRHFTEQAVHPLPKAIIRKERTIGFYKINGMVSDYRDIGLGSEKCFGVVESGFHGQEWNGGKPFRWTDGNAKLIVPLNPEHPPRALMVEIVSNRPKESKLKILLNNHEMYQGQVGAGFWSKTFSLADLRLGSEATLEIISDTFVPKEEIHGSTDTRTLGVTVQDICLLESVQPRRSHQTGLISDYVNIRLGSEKQFGVLESGYYDQEWEEGNPFRWTDGNARLIVPLIPEHPPKSLRVELLSYCPNELKVQIFLNRHELYQGQIAPGKKWSKTFSLDGIPVGKEATIEIVSGKFVPKEIIKGSLDTRTLGVIVRDIRLLEND